MAEIERLEARVARLEEIVEDLRVRSSALGGVAFDVLGILRELAPIEAAKRLVDAQEELSRQRGTGDKHQLLGAAFRASWMLNAMFPGDDAPPEPHDDPEALN